MVSRILEDLVSTVVFLVHQLAATSSATTQLQWCPGYRGSGCSLRRFLPPGPSQALGTPRQFRLVSFVPLCCICNVIQYVPQSSQAGCLITARTLRKNPCHAVCSGSRHGCLASPTDDNTRDKSRPGQVSGRRYLRRLLRTVEREKREQTHSVFGDKVASLFLGHANSMHCGPKVPSAMGCLSRTLPVCTDPLKECHCSRVSTSAAKDYL